MSIIEVNLGRKRKKMLQRNEQKLCKRGAEKSVEVRKYRTAGRRLKIREAEGGWEGKEKRMSDSRREAMTEKEEKKKEKLSGGRVS